MLIFGGLNENRESLNTLYAVRPLYEKNKKYLYQKTGEFKNVNKIKLKFQISIVETTGKPPCSRYMHSATFIKKYLVIFGGRNDNILADSGNVALNDLHLFDV